MHGYLFMNTAYMMNSTQEYNTSTEFSFEDEVLQTREMQVLHQIQTFVPPFFVILGTIGNITSLILLMTRQSGNGNSICVYLASLTLCNLLTLDLWCGVDWIAHVSDHLYFANIVDWFCRLW